MQLSDISPEGQSRSQPMNQEQFSNYAAQGQAELQRQASTAPRGNTGVYTAPGATQAAYEAVQKPWGGTTMSGNGTAITPGENTYAVSAKAPGQQSVTIPTNVNQEQFSGAMSQAKQQFRGQLKAGAYLGAFHNASANQIEFDPSRVVSGEETAKQVGAATGAVGGAYHFSSGEGVFPPHVANDNATGVRDAGM